ncbi:DUF4184 family protein [Sphaerisporangium album]|uniref:DUF4184 family protein n=1 Tax=Sphaerisporangium album TaxID=509200 RepID=A0A367FCE0_9ACTN|nr:DUF4184 family protein [Sphaerisporangium album]RCG27357.1 DUF4184 family protein [Sphaerisporangium album]
MPFTPSHVAAVVPLISSARVRRVLDPWALGVGSMVPDLPMFLPYLDAYTRWHSPIGIVTDDLVATIVLLALLRFVFRDPLTALLPGPLAARLAALPGPAWRRFPAIVLGAVAGAATHVVWDSFTHDWGAAFWGWSWMTASVFGRLPGYRLAQYACSALGLAVVAWWAARGLRSPGTVPLPPRLAMPVPLRRGVLACTGVGACCAAAVWTLVDPPNPVFGWAGVVTKTGVGLLVGFCAVLTAYALLWHLLRLIRWSRTRARREDHFDTRATQS